jgi:deoxyribonuclease V
MLAALDAKYDEPSRTAKAAAIVFQHWHDREATAQYAADFENVQPYIPGEFFRRELPVLLALLELIREPLSTVLVDGYVRLGDRPGLGLRLWQATGERFPVIGVAKSPFHGGRCVEVLRGKSRKPLYVTSVGIDPDAAADCVKRMHGSTRIPALLKRVDQLTRQ